MKLGLILLFSAGAWATSFFQQPFPSTVQDAPVIVHGKVGMSYSDWGKGDDGTKRIYTYYELQVEESLKGTAQGPSLSMRELGGEKDGIGMQVPGSAHFDRGEDVVVMLGPKNLEGSYDVWGMSMGKYNLQKDDAGHEVVTGPGISSATPDGDGIVHPEENGTETHDARGASVWTLEKLRALIRAQSQTKANSNLRPTTPSSKSPSPSPLSATPVATREAPALQNQLDPENGSSGLVLFSRFAIIILGLGILLWIRKKLRARK